jgi:hypothetical protein
MQVTFFYANRLVCGPIVCGQYKESGCGRVFDWTPQGFKVQGCCSRGQVTRDGLNYVWRGFTMTKQG